MSIEGDWTQGTWAFPPNEDGKKFFLYYAPPSYGGVLSEGRVLLLRSYLSSAYSGSAQVRKQGYAWVRRPWNPEFGMVGAVRDLLPDTTLILAVYHSSEGGWDTLLPPSEEEALSLIAEITIAALSIGQNVPNIWRNE